MTGYITDYVIIKFMTLQLLFFLDASFNKHVILKIMAWLKEKKTLKLNWKLRKKLYV